MKQTLSVLIANYNHGKYLQTLLPALFQQSRQPDEVIIVDDASTDESIAIIEDFQSSEKRVQLFKNTKNQGAVFSINFAVSKATGTHITFPAADNFILPGLYEKSLKILEQHPQAGLCCTDPLYFNEKTGVTYGRSLRLSANPCYLAPEELIAALQKQNFSIGHLGHTVVVKKQALLEFANGDEFFIKSLEWHCDFFAWNAIAFRYGVCYIPEGLASLRLHPEGYSQRKYSWTQRMTICKALLLCLERDRNLKDTFKRSCVLGELKLMLITLLTTPKYYNYISKRLITRSLYVSTRSLIARIPYARKLYQSLKKV